MSGLLPTWWELSDACLVVVESVRDGRCHLVDEAHYAREMRGAGSLGLPRILGQCEDVVIAGALAGPPRPACARCVAAAGPRLLMAADERAARERAARPPGRWTRMARVAGLHLHPRAGARHGRAAVSE